MRTGRICLVLAGPHILLVFLQMSRSVVSGGVFFLLLACRIASFAAETLQDTLRATRVPTELFPESELGGKITSYAISSENPFLLAYYVDDGSGILKPPLHVIRYDRVTGDLRRADLRDINALFQGKLPLDCLGSALQIREHSDRIYIDTHDNPSAGCVIVLSSTLALEAALSGSLLGLIGADYAIVQGSEIHFMSVHPMHIEILDVKRNQSTQLYPYKDDPQRRQFSRLIEPHISEKWCIESNAQCDPGNFDTNLQGKVIVNDAAEAFGFLAQFDAVGFGDAAEKQVTPRTVAYIFRERGGRWEHREFEGRQLQRLLSEMSFDEVIKKKPDLPFQSRRGK
jgi:hypothetical protein